MNQPEFERRITDTAEALRLCALSIKENDPFEIEKHLGIALKDLQGCQEYAEKMADAFEKLLGETEEAKGYEEVRT